MFSQFWSLVSDPSFWAVVLTIIAGVGSIPGGPVAQIAETALGALTRWGARRLPANEWQVVQSLAQQVVHGVAQEAHNYAWTNADKKAQAFARLQALLHAHGITRFDPFVLEGEVERAWAIVKVWLAGTPASTPLAPPTLAPATPAAPATPNLSALLMTPGGVASGVPSANTQPATPASSPASATPADAPVNPVSDAPAADAPVADASAVSAPAVDAPVVDAPAFGSDRAVLPASAFTASAFTASA